MSALDKIKRIGKNDRLSLHEFGLTAIPEEVRALTKLTKLSLQSNELTELPSWLGELTDLRILNLADNKKLSKNLDVIAKLKKLEELDLRDLPVMPRVESIAAPIEQLFLGGPKFRAIPPWVFGLKKTLRVLNIESAALKTVPADIGKLTNLEELWLDGEISKLSPEIAKLPKLRVLNVSDCKLTTVPAAEIAAMKSLETIDLSRNKINGWKAGMEKEAPAKVLEALMAIGVASLPKSKKSGKDRRQKRK
jgi:Leucine-rich repeat (LRR) protein